MRCFASEWSAPRAVHVLTANVQHRTPNVQRPSNGTQEPTAGTGNVGDGKVWAVWVLASQSTIRNPQFAINRRRTGDG